jgi:hypothetical protein
VDRQSNEIRIFTSDGRISIIVGGTGGGPGRFFMPQLVPVAAAFDSIVIFDPRQARLTAFSQTGKLLSTRRITGMRNTSGRFVGLLRNGSLLNIRSISPPPVATGLSHTVIAVEILDVGPDSVRATNIVTDSTPTIAIVDPRSPRSIEMGAWMPFRVRPSAAVGSRSVFATIGRSAEILRFGASGCREQLITISGPLRRIPPGAYERWIEWGLSRVSDKATARSLYSEIPRPQGLPAWQNLIVDEDDFLWAEVYRQREDSLSNQWIIFRPSGEAVGTVDLPPKLEVLQIGRYHVLGRWIDSLGLEYVRRYYLRRTP